ncbi:hypothetical protein [Nonomuraea sp. NPDC002799]
MGFAPNAIFVACLWALIRTDSFSGRGRWENIVPHTPTGLAGALAGICACAAVLGLLLHPFQIRAVRMLEGYWDRWLPTARLADVLVEYQRRKRQSASEMADGAGNNERKAGPRSAMSLPEQTRNLDTAAQRMRANARRRLGGMPPAEVLLPTALGNALRAGEIQAGERYGLTTLTTWPRIYPQLSRPLAKAVASARDSLDTSVNLCYSFLACAVVMGVAMYDEPGKWWFPPIALAAAALAYKGAVTAAQGYAQLMHIVYDLHRFDLVRALHYQLPDRDSEQGLFRRISEALANKAVNLPYDHGRSYSDEADRTT